MGLKRASESPGLRRIEPRDYPRDAQGLIAQLSDADPSVRRWAARDLVHSPEATTALCRRLLEETDSSVKEVLFTTLNQLASLEVAHTMVNLLRSEDPGMRNRAIEVLAGLPQLVAPLVDDLLKDSNADVRIFTVNMLADLQHPHINRWIAQILQHDKHVNVVGAALDVAAEVGNSELLPALQSAKRRFADDPYVGFAADLAQQRIEAS